MEILYNIFIFLLYAVPLSLVLFGFPYFALWRAKNRFLKERFVYSESDFVKLSSHLSLYILFLLLIPIALYSLFSPKYGLLIFALPVFVFLIIFLSILVHICATFLYRKKLKSFYRTHNVDLISQTSKVERTKIKAILKILLVLLILSLFIFILLEMTII